jgi:hypothetical protein
MKFSLLAQVAFAGALCLSSVSNAALLYGIDDSSGQSIVSFDSANPSNYLSGATISGLQNNETIKGIDFRPSTHQLFALGSSNRLYTLNVTTGVATAVSAAPFGPLSGANYGFDFNPVIDRIRVVSNTDTNYVLNPNDGTLQATATNLFFGPADPNFGVSPNVAFSAYTNSVIPAPGATQLYGIDSGLDILVTQANSAGTLGTVGPLGVNVGAVGGFDIFGTSNVAYAAMLPAATSVSKLYSINLATGAATELGEIDGGAIISSLAAAPAGFDPDVIVPEPTTVALAALALAGFVGRRIRG